jgi:hypothetical protein
MAYNRNLRQLAVVLFNLIIALQVDAYLSHIIANSRIVALIQKNIHFLKWGVLATDGQYADLCIVHTVVI